MVFFCKVRDYFLYFVERTVFKILCVDNLLVQSTFLVLSCEEINDWHKKTCMYTTKPKTRTNVFIENLCSWKISFNIFQIKLMFLKKKLIVIRITLWWFPIKSTTVFLLNKKKKRVFLNTPLHFKNIAFNKKLPFITIKKIYIYIKIRF